MINQIIKDWVGEDKTFNPQPFPNGKEGVFDAETAQISINNFRDMPDPSFLRGYNQALQDLTSRIPQLTERIEKEVEQRLKESWNKSIDEKLPLDLGDALLAINTLKGGKE